MTKIVEEQWTCYRPLSRDQLFSRFELPEGTSKHLLILYSLAIGLKAKVIVDIGLGQTTGALRAAAAHTGATLYTCDFDKRRFEHVLSEQDEQWKLYLEHSSVFLQRVPEPVDLVMHDGAHDYANVKRDLEVILPKMRRFGIICMHDTQQLDLYQDMLAAIRDATKGFEVSITNLPFNSGLAVIRVESSVHPEISPSTGSLPDGTPETKLVAFATIPTNQKLKVSPVRGHFMAAKIRLGHLLRQAGLRS
jgi:predicted O-methyltransferase YrrM